MIEEAQTQDFFTEGELEVLAQLLLALLRADACATESEHAAFVHVARRLRLRREAQPDSPYRAPAAETSDEPGREAFAVFGACLERARAVAPDRGACMRAARSIERIDARDAMYAALFDVAASDFIAEVEWELLEALARLWQLDLGERSPASDA